MRPGGRREAPTVDDRGGRAGHLGRPLPGVRPGAGSHDGSHAGRLLRVRIEPRGTGPACRSRESRRPHLGPARQRRRRDRGGEATSGARARGAHRTRRGQPGVALHQLRQRRPRQRHLVPPAGRRGVPVAAARGGRERPRIRGDLPAAVALVGDADRPDEPEPLRPASSTRHCCRSPAGNACRSPSPRSRSSAPPTRTPTRTTRRWRASCLEPAGPRRPSMRSYTTDSSACAQPVDPGSVTFPLPRGARYVDNHNWGGRGSHWMRMHTGTDLSVACGTPVLAATVGTRAHPNRPGVGRPMAGAGQHRDRTAHDLVRPHARRHGARTARPVAAGPADRRGRRPGQRHRLPPALRGAPPGRLDLPGLGQPEHLAARERRTEATGRVAPAAWSSGSEAFTVATFNVLGNSHTARRRREAVDGLRTGPDSRGRAAAREVRRRRGRTAGVPATAAPSVRGSGG